MTEHNQGADTEVQETRFVVVPHGRTFIIMTNAPDHGKHTVVNPPPGFVFKTAVMTKPGTSILDAKGRSAVGAEFALFYEFVGTVQVPEEHAQKALFGDLRSN